MESGYKLHQEMLITGELYWQLRSAGMLCFLETVIPSRYHTSGLMRVDVAVVEGGEVLVAIEVKKEGKKMKETNRQAKAYRDLSRFNIQPIFINAASEIPQGRCRS